MIRSLILAVAVAMAGISVSAAPPPGPPPQFAPIPGPKIINLSEGLTLCIPEGAGLKRHASAEYWQPETFTLQMDKGWASISIDHERIDKPRRSDRLKRIGSNTFGVMHTYRANPDIGAIHRVIITPRKRRDPYVSVALLAAAAKESQEVKYGWRSTRQLTESDIPDLLGLFNPTKPCVGSESADDEDAVDV